MANDLPELQPYEIEPYDSSQEEFHESSLLTEYEEDKPKRNLPLLLGIGAAVTIGAVGLLFLLLGGGGGAGGEVPDPGLGNGNDNENVTIFWWGVFMDKEAIQPLLDEYKSLNPNVTVQYTDVMESVAPNTNFNTAAEEYQFELNRILDNDNPTDNPDIFMVHNTWAGDYEVYAQPSLTYTFDDISNSFFPAVQKDFANQGVVFGVPLWMDTLAVIYNNDLLSAESITTPSEDWFLFKEDAEALTKFEGNTMTQAGFSAGSFATTSFNFDLINLLLFQNGVEVTNDLNEPVFDTDPDALDAISFLNSFYRGSSTTWNDTFGYDSAALLEGNLAMTIAPSWRLREILRVNEAFNLNLDLRVAKVPQIEGQGQDIINWADYWGNIVSAGRPYTVESWDFLRWITEPAQQKKLHENIKNTHGYFGHIYPRTDMQTELIDDEYLKVYNESAPFAETWYMVKGREVKQLFVEMLKEGADEGNMTALVREIITLQSLKGLLTTENEDQ